MMRRRGLRVKGRRSGRDGRFGEEVVVDGLGGPAAVGDGVDDEVGAPDGVAAGEDAFYGGAAGGRLDYDEALAVGLQPVGAGGDEVVDVVADGEDYAVHGQGELGAGDGDRPGPARLVGLPQLHPLALHRLYSTLGI